MKFLLLGLLFFCIAALIGALGYSTYTSNYAHKQTAVQLSRLQRAVLAAPLWKYGVVESVDASASTLTARFSTGKTFELQVPSNTLIARQDMTATNNVYTEVTSPTQATLADLHAGDNILVITTIDAKGAGIANMILFGNPL